jgi:cytochrome P450
VGTEIPFPLYGRDFKRDPYPTYQGLRDSGPVHRVEFPSGVHAWVVTGYDAAVRTLSDDRLGKNHALGNDAWRRLAAIMPEPQHSLLQVHMLHQDPPAHTVMRKLVTDTFGPRSVAARRADFERLADDLLAGLAAAGGGDLVASFGVPFPFQVLSEMIGLPEEFRRGFRHEWCKVVAPVGPRSPHRQHYIDLLHGLQAYIDDVIAHFQRHPDASLLGRLVAAHADGALDRPQLSSMIFQLIVAGLEPVTNQISTSVVALLTHPERQAQLVKEPAGIPAAVEELLRFDGGFELTTWRFFRDTTEHYGVRIPAGDSVIVSLAAANRDPRRFGCPDELRFERSPNPHLAFGHGIHFCAGAALARLELEVALAGIVRRLPKLALAVPVEELEWVPSVLGRGVSHLPVSCASST